MRSVFESNKLVNIRELNPRLKKNCTVLVIGWRRHFDWCQHAGPCIAEVKVMAGAILGTKS